MAKVKNWVVVTDGKHSLSDMKKQLSASGFNVDQVLDAIGCITGSANDDVADKVRTLPGVADVSPEPPPTDIGPPDAEIS